MNTIFYSWQSDSPRKTNHDFIEECLRAAADKIRNANKQEIEVLDGVRGESGTPPLADTILKRISAAHVYVADLTLAYEFVGSDGKRRSPNPNVTFEFGYAVAELSLGRVIGVLNEHYASPDQFPFDFKHLRWPLTYTLAPDCSDTQRDKCKKQLTKQLEIAIVAVLSEKGPLRLLAPRKAAILTSLSMLVETNQRWRAALMGKAPHELKELGLAKAERVVGVINSLKRTVSAATTIWELDTLDTMIADLRLSIAGSPEVIDQLAFEQKQIEKLQSMIDRLQTTQREIEHLEMEKARSDSALVELDAEMSSLKAKMIQPPDVGAQNTSANTGL